MGTAEIYDAVEGLAEVDEALIVGVERDDGNYWMPLFIKLSLGAEWSLSLSAKISNVIRSSVSPHYVPDEILIVRAVPHTLTGKKLELPIKRLLQGASIEDVVNLDSVDDPQLFIEFAQMASARLEEERIARG